MVAGPTGFDALMSLKEGSKFAQVHTSEGSNLWPTLGKVQTMMLWT